MKCPGQDTQFWTLNDVFEVSCGQCGYLVEFFKNDVNRSCPNCKTLIKNPKLNLGCAQWCAHAKECLGFEPEKISINQNIDISLADRLIKAMKHEFGDDQKRIKHTLIVFDQAQKIMCKEGGDPRVVIAAAILHDIGIQEAERKYGSSAGKYQEIEGPPIAKRIMEELGFESSTVEHVCRIVGSHHSGRDIDTLEFSILWDADWIVNFRDEFAGLNKEKLKSKIDKIFKTKNGKKKAYQMFIEN